VVTSSEITGLLFAKKSRTRNGTPNSNRKVAVTMPARQATQTSRLFLAAVKADSMTLAMAPSTPTARHSANNGYQNSLFMADNLVDGSWDA